MKLEIIPPLTPNFLQIKTGAHHTHRPIKEFTKEQLIEVADKWKQELLKKHSAL